MLNLRVHATRVCRFEGSQLLLGGIAIQHVVSSREPTQAAQLRPDSRPPECLFVSIGFRDRVRDGVGEGTEGCRRFGSQKLDKKARSNERHQEPQ